MRQQALLVLAIVVFTCGVSISVTRANFVSNGDFSQYSAYNIPGVGPAVGYEIGPLSGTATNLTGWTSAGANALFLPSTNCSTCPGSYSPQFNGYLKLWAADNGGANTWNGRGPSMAGYANGMNFIAADPSWQTGALTQAIAGLTVGRRYQVSFNWASGQEKNYTGVTKAAWTVALGNQSFSTIQATNASQGFTDWTGTSFLYTATATSMLLSFLASAPSGNPPYALLANINMSSVPEPSTLLILAVSALGIASARQRRV